MERRIRMFRAFLLLGQSCLAWDQRNVAFSSQHKNHVRLICVLDRSIGLCRTRLIRCRVRLRLALRHVSKVILRALIVAAKASVDNVGI